jgi:hypothetical protein
MLAMIPLPRNSGQATVHSSITCTNPGGPARKLLSHSPDASDVAMNIFWQRTKSRIAGLRWPITWSS